MYVRRSNLKTLLLVVCLTLVVGCGASREVRDYLEKLGPPKNHLAEVEKLRQPIFQRTMQALKQRRTGDPFAELAGLRAQMEAARTESAAQRQYLTGHPCPPDCRGFYIAYYKFLQAEDSYFKGNDVIFAALDGIPRGGAAPNLIELEFDDQVFSKMATSAAEDFKAIQATYERTR